MFHSAIQKKNWHVFYGPQCIFGNCVVYVSLECHLFYVWYLVETGFG